MVNFEVKERIGYITINRPEKKNALNDDVVRELTKAFIEAEQNNEVKIIVLKSIGDVFCSGADMEYMQKLQQNSYEDNLEDSTNLKDLFTLIYRLKKVVIAQVQGHAIAGGFGLATVCDFTFADKAARFGYTEAKIGFVPAIVSVFLIRKVGESVARNLLLSARLISAKQAKKLRIIFKVTETLEEDVNRFANRLLKSNSSYSMAATKHLIDEVQSQPLEDALNYAAEINAKARGSEAAKKGFDAFLNKKKITW